MKKRNETVVPFSAVGRKEQYDATEEKNRNIVGLKIRDARKSKGLSIAAFSDLLKSYGVDVSVNGAGKWELGYSIPNAYQLIAVCLALEIEDQIPYFMGSYMPPLNEIGMNKVAEYRSDLIASGRYRPDSQESEIIRLIEMPVSDLAVSAGTGNFLDDSNFEMCSFREEEVPDGADFGVRVSGDSMEPAYHDGQIVWVQECEQVGTGQVGIFIYGGEGFLKIYAEREPDENDAEAFTDSYGNVHPQAVLESLNPKYEPRLIRPDTLFKVVGRVL